MEPSHMLTEMCQQVLSTADIKAICKRRGFSAREASSRTMFENYFLSDIGVTAALASLSQEEIILLHLLQLENQAVDIRFFEPLAQSKHAWHSTFTQRYTPVFKAVQHSLIRQGVLLNAVAAGTATKMERWRFRFPREFEAFLPPIFRHPATFKVTGEVRHAALRERIMAILQDHRRAGDTEQNEYPVTLDHGQLLIEQRPFSLNGLLQWQQAHWQQSVWAARRKPRGPSRSKVTRLTAASLAASTIEQKPFAPLVHYAWSQLDADAWILCGELSTLLRLFYAGATPPDSKEVCDLGWKLGCLAKHTVQGQDYYRLATLPEAAGDDPKRYLAIASDSALDVDLETIPYASLECLAALAEFQVVGCRLRAMPHPIRLGRAPEAMWHHPLTEWLRQNSTVFRQALETIEARRGKQIVHANLLLARVKDLTLKVQIQKAFSDPNHLVLLPNDFIAFPPERLRDLQRVVEKSGYVVKTVRAS